MPMKLFVGLGNPGPGYARHRHNIGFMAADAIAAAHGFGPWRAKFHGQIAEGRLGAEKVLLLKPGTYMNLSGDAVRAALQFYKLEPGDVVVFHDELDLAPGRVRVKTGGGTAGHNGIRSIDAHIGPDFTRVRLGIGHPGDKRLVSNHVLGDFAKADAEWVDDLLRGVADGAPALAAGDTAGFLDAVARRMPPPRCRRSRRPPAPAAAPAGPRTPRPAAAAGGPVPLTGAKPSGCRPGSAPAWARPSPPGSGPPGRPAGPRRKLRLGRPIGAHGAHERRDRDRPREAGRLSADAADWLALRLGAPRAGRADLHGSWVRWSGWSWPGTVAAHLADQPPLVVAYRLHREARVLHQHHLRQPRLGLDRHQRHRAGEGRHGPDVDADPARVVGGRIRGAPRRSTSTTPTTALMSPEW